MDTTINENYKILITELRRLKLDELKQCDVYVDELNCYWCKEDVIFCLFVLFITTFFDCILSYWLMGILSRMMHVMRFIKFFVQNHVLKRIKNTIVSIEKCVYVVI